ncbi:MAG: hypothetical protein EHM83_00600, partial [Burkholderiales bacterium]
MASSLRRRWAVLLALVAFAAPVMADGPAAVGTSRVPKPTVAATAAGSCVEDTAFMRRNHMQ